jgi:DNA repair protein RecN (Recombination protein N)
VLRDLHLRNLAVLAGAAVEFGPGLNVLTGETGAGKSIVVDSLALLGGARSSSDLVRTGADALSVTGVFQVGGEEWRVALEAAGIPAEGDEVVVRREIGREGRNRVFLNDQPATLRLLAEMAPHLLHIHGQREELGLVAPDLQRAWLDRSGGEEGEELLRRTAEAHAVQARLRTRLEAARGDERARRERLDLLRFQAEEIDAAGLRPGEDEALRAERLVLRHAEAIRGALGAGLALLHDDEGAAVERLARARQRLEEIEDWEPQAGAWREELEELRIRGGELADALRRRLEGVESDPARLDAVEERLATLERLCRKHGAAAVAEVLDRRQAIGGELDELAGDLEHRDELEEKAAAALAEYRRLALELSRRRGAWGKALVLRIEAELAELALGRARFAVALERRPRADSPLALDGTPVDFGPQGVDQVVFLFSPNPGEALRPVARAASGGELSRIYLALRLAVRGELESAAAPTLVFDEADAGIGGAEAAALGRKLKRLARGGQILVVTHLAQVASHGDHHFRVSKRVEGGRTFASVERLSPRERVEEVARMLAGKKVTALSRSHAEEMIASAAASAAASAVERGRR